MTLSLGLVSLVMGIGLGVVLGVIGAIRPRGIVDRGITALSSVMLAIPSFWLALVLILIFAVENPIFPTIGYAPLLEEGPYEWLRHLILPAIALSLSAAATIALQLKAALVAEEGSDYLLAARAKGLTRSSLLFKHSFKNAAVPVVTILGFRVCNAAGRYGDHRDDLRAARAGSPRAAERRQPGRAGRPRHLLTVTSIFIWW